MSTSLRVRLSVMMFLQYMVWGLWFIKLGSYLPHIEITGYAMGNIFMAFFLAFLVSPFIGGQLADRYMPSQVVMGIAHIIGGGLLVYLADIQDYNTLWWIMFVYALFYAPTLALSNSISFHNLENPDKSFGPIRVWGTIGWVMAGLLLTFWWSQIDPFTMNWSEILELPESQQAAQKASYVTTESWLFTLAGVVSIGLGIYCFFLPHTPPKKEAENPFAFLKAISLCKNFNFAFFIILSFIVATELQFFYILTPPYLESNLINISPENTSAYMSIFAQGAEGVTLLLVLPFALSKLGLRKTIAIGIIAWPIRYAIFSLAYPVWLVILSLALHGICYVFFFIAGQMFVDRVAPKDIRGSAQGLIFMVTFGGLAAGSMFVGWVTQIFTIQVDGQSVVQYQWLFLLPCVLTVLCAIAFMIFFKEPEKVEEEIKEEITT